MVRLGQRCSKVTNFSESTQKVQFTVDQVRECYQDNRTMFVESVNSLHGLQTNLERRRERAKRKETEKRLWSDEWRTVIYQDKDL